MSAMFPCRKAQAAGDVAVLATSPWQRKRHWFAPAPHLPLTQAVALGPETAHSGEQNPCCPATLLLREALTTPFTAREMLHQKCKIQALTM